MALRSESTSHSLEKKLLIAGFEVPDVLAIFLLLSILNFIFGHTNQKLLLVWGPTILLALTLRIGKRDKPDNYLLHLAKFQVQPKHLSAFQDPQVNTPPPRIRRKKS